MAIQAHYWIQGLDMSVFAERLRLLRQARNITQARLAELIEVSPRSITAGRKAAMCRISIPS